MKTAMLFVASVAIATPAMAQHDHEEMRARAQAQAGPPTAAPPQGQAGAPTMAAPGQGRGPQQPPIDVPWNDAIPAGTPEHAARALKESPRHGEWVDITLADGTALKSWVVYPERSTKSGVVLVIHDIRGMSDIARAVGDQLAQDGFIAIVPDFLSGKGPNGGGTDSLGNGVGQAIQQLTPDDVVARLNAAMEYGKKLPASNGKTGVVGFCWGGSQSFLYASQQPNLNAAVVFYGSAPGSGTNDATADSVAAQLTSLKAPVLGMYAGSDMRINGTLPVTEAAMQKLGKSLDKHIFEGAGHGFVFAQDRSAANLKATQDAWPLVLQFYRANLK